MLVVLFILMMLDFTLTKIGIVSGAITEGNRWMLWLVNMPDLTGTIIREIMCCLLLYPIYLAKDINKTLYRIAITITLSANVFIMFMHGYWISVYLKY